MYPSKIRDHLKTGKPVLSTSLSCTHIATPTYNLKPDWVWIDTEHSPWGVESLGSICTDGRKKGVAPVIRIPWNDPSYIKKSYDVGAVGVMIPQVDNVEEVKQAVHDAKYPPIGERGIAPWFASQMDNLSQQDVVDHANNETLLILQMESAEAYEQIDDILAIDNFEVILVGPADLSASLGYPGADATHPKTENVMIDMAQKVKGTGKALATTMGDVEHAKRWIKEGYTMMNIGSVLGYGTMGLSKIFQDIREEYGVDWWD
jgi:2-keto-3-deoxy-L-rhamnonate aldolase RhmA